MKIIIKLAIYMFLFIITIGNLNAEDTNIIDGNYNIEEIKYQKNIKKDEIFNINLNILKKELEEVYKSRILFEWNIAWENTQNWSVFEKQFEKTWNYEINLSIYKTLWVNKELITNKKINIFVYSEEITQIFDEELWEKIENFVINLKDSWIYVNKIIINPKDINKTKFWEKILNKIEESNYLVIWWWKEFIFDILSKINSEKIEKSLNLVIISSFNINILQKYIWNFTSNKNWIKDAILIDESSKYEILKEANNIEALKEEMWKNDYEYISLNPKSDISNVLFISKFINNLSNNWFSTINIYLVLIIPFLLVGIIIFKHLIGLGTTGILIPTTITLLFLKLSFIPTIILIVIFLITNLILSKLIYIYNLHYTPRLVLVTIINIIIIIITTNIFISYKLVNIETNDIMFIIFFILISEKLINIILSKDFSEYKMSLLNTLVFSIISYIFFSLAITKTFILSYPEIILLFIPISFIIWRFTGLRMTEYFRFKEVIKSIEEE